MPTRPAQQQQPWTLLLPALLLTACAAAAQAPCAPHVPAGLHGTRSARKVLLQVQSSGPGPPLDGLLTGAHAWPRLCP